MEKHTKLLLTSPRQLAALRSDGFNEASTALHAIFRSDDENCMALASGFVDVPEACDMVTYDKVLLAVQQISPPGPLLEYLELLYDNSAVQIGEQTVWCNGGLRHADSLSPLPIIAVVDEVIPGSIPQLGITVNEGKANHLVYVDDLIIFA